MSTIKTRVSQACEEIINHPLNNRSMIKSNSELAFDAEVRDIMQRLLRSLAKVEPAAVALADLLENAHLVDIVAEQPRYTDASIIYLRRVAIEDYRQMLLMTLKNDYVTAKDKSKPKKATKCKSSNRK